jgi:hypothetical protein
MGVGILAPKAAFCHATASTFCLTIGSIPRATLMRHLQSEHIHMSESARRFGSQSRLRQSIRKTEGTIEVGKLRRSTVQSNDSEVITEHTDLHHGDEQEPHLK